MLSIKKSKIPDAGKGLFANRLFRRGEAIVEYKGEVLTWKECERRNEARKKGFCGYYFFINNRRCIDAQNTPEELARYANDAAGFVRIPGIRNNSRYEIIKGKPFIIASRNIHPGDEIYVSYGKEYWDALRENGYGPKPDKKTTAKKQLNGHEHHATAKRVVHHNH